MKHKSLIGLAMVCLTLSGCGDDESTGDGRGGSSATGGRGTAGSGDGGHGGEELGGAGGQGGAPAWLALQGAACPLEGCPDPLECLQYCGIAGCGGGGTFTSCEIPCSMSAPDSCPSGQTCFSISDGPGDVCQPG